MKLVIGGAFQGKFNFVKKQFPDVKEWLDGYTCSRREIFACKGMVHFHDFTNNIKPQTRSAGVAVAGSVGTVKRFKQMGKRILRYVNSCIFNLTTNGIVSLG